MDEPEHERMPYHVAARLPPSWDAPANRQKIYSAFERLQICLKCGNMRQVTLMMISLKRLTAAAERRRRCLVGEATARLEALGVEDSAA